MQHVGGDDGVALMRRETLEARIGVDVEQHVLEEGKVRKADARLAEERLGDVGEDVLFAHAPQDRQDTGRCATRAGADLECHHASLRGQLREHCLDSGHDALVVERTCDGALVERQYQLEGPAREEELHVGDFRHVAIERIPEARPHPLRKLQLGPQCPVRREYVGRCNGNGLSRRRRVLGGTPRVQELVMPHGHLGHRDGGHRLVQVLLAQGLEL